MANISLANLYVLFKARGLTRLKTRINILKRDLMGVSNHLDSIEHKAKIAFMGTGVSIGAAVWQAAKFQEQMANVNTMLYASDSHFLPKYTESIKKLSIQYGESTETISKGLYDILSASVPAAQAQSVLEVSMKAAAAGLTDAGVTADALTTILNSFQISATGVTGVFDKMFQTIKDGKLTPVEYANNIGKLTATAHIAGLSLEEMNAGVSTLTRSGINANRAMAHYVGFIRAYIKPTKEAKDTAMKYGVSLSEAHLRTVGLIGAVKELSNLPADALTKIFGDVRGFKAASIFKTDLEGLTKDIQNQYNSFGKGGEATAKVMNNMMMSLKQLRESFLVLLKEGGTIFTPIISGASKLIQAFAETSPIVKQIIFGFISLKMAVSGLQLATMLFAKMEAAKTALLAKDTLQTNINTASIYKNTAALATNAAAAKKRNIFPRGLPLQVPDGFLKNQTAAVKHPTSLQMLYDQVRQDRYKVRAIPIPRMKTGELTKGLVALKETGLIMGKGGKGIVRLIGNLTGLSDVFSILRKAIVALAAPISLFIGSIVAIGVGVALVTDRLLGGAWAWDTWAKKARDEKNVKVWKEIADAAHEELSEIQKNIDEINKQLEMPIDSKKRANLLAERGKLEEKQLRAKLGRSQKLLEDSQRIRNELRGSDDSEGIERANRDITNAQKSIDNINKRLDKLGRQNALAILNATLEENKEAFNTALNALSDYSQKSWEGSKKIEASIDLINKKYSESSSTRGTAQRIEIEKDIDEQILREKQELSEKIKKIQEQEAASIQAIIMRSGATTQEIQNQKYKYEADHFARIEKIRERYKGTNEKLMTFQIERENAYYNTVIKNRNGLVGAYGEEAYAAHSAAQTAIKDAERLINFEEKRNLLIKQRLSEDIGRFNEKRRQTEQSNAIELEKYEVEQNITDEYRKRLRLAQIERRESQRQIWGAFGENANKFGELFRGDLLKGTQADLFKTDLEYLKRMREIAKDIASNISSVFSNISSKFGDVIDKIQEIINPQMKQQNVYNKMREDLFSIVDKYDEATKNITDKSKLIPKSYYKDMFSAGVDVIQEGSRTIYKSRKEYKSLAQYYKDIFASGTNVLEKLEKNQKQRDIAGKFMELTDVWRNLQSSAAKPSISLSMGEQQQLNEMIQLRTFLENQVKNGITVQLKV